MYPKAKREQFERFEIGDFAVNRPNGVVIHYTADTNLERVIDALAEKRFGYHLIIDRDGRVIQLARTSKKVCHAGSSTWNGLFCNSSFLGVSLVSWGMLSPEGTSWAGAKIDKSEIKIDKKELWHEATKIQIEKLWEVLEWCKLERKIPARNVCGHSECCIPVGRKIDPGKILPYSMNVLRTALTMMDKRLLNA
jgi:N-acetyl-anhydromuramyl-L-alanine amidase AmpD